jgi:predicted nucleotidyltransferase
MPADLTSQAAAMDFARDFVGLANREFGSRLLGAYLIGSLAHGGFSERYSDIDVTLIVQQALTAAELDRLRQAAAARSPELASRLSIFWADRTFSAGRFPPLDRIDTIDHGIAVIERERVMPPHPTLTDVRSYLAGPPFENWSNDAARFSALDRLADSDRKRYLRALLYPARFLYSWTTGSICSNDAAVAFLQRATPAGLDVDLIARALHCRIDGRHPDALFAERSKLPRLVEVCRTLSVGQAPG